MNMIFYEWEKKSQWFLWNWKSEKYFRKKWIFLSKKMIEKMLKFVLEREKFLIDFYISW